MIAQKFGLDQAQVQSVFDQFRQERRQEMQQTAQQREEDRLNKLVEEGKITKEQKQAILDKLAELRKKYNPDNFKDWLPDHILWQKQIPDTVSAGCPKPWRKNQNLPR